MVIINKAVVERELRRRGWTPARLIAEMDVVENTVRSMMDLGPVAHRTQLALFNAFQGHVPFQKLFTVTPGPDGAATPEQREEAVA